jgi:nucleoside 2-deoxyribosyltransferase
MASIYPQYPENIAYKVYLAGSWSRKNELAEYRERLAGYGIETVSRWLDESADASVELHEVTDEYLIASAKDDIEDIMSSHAFILFSNGYGYKSAGGGRFFEMGFAYSRSIPLITVGDEEMIFQKLSRDPVNDLFYTVPDFHACVSLLLNWANAYARDAYRKAERRANRALLNEMLVEVTTPTLSEDDARNVMRQLSIGGMGRL